MSYYLVKVVFCQVGCCVFFGVAANLSDHHDSFGLGILEEDVDAVNKVCPVERIATDSDAQRLAKSGFRRLMDRLII